MTIILPRFIIPNMAQLDTKDAVLTPEELALRWKVSYNTIMKEIQNGNIVSFRVRRQYRIPLDVVEDLEKTGQIPKEPK